MRPRRVSTSRHSLRRWAVGGALGLLWVTAQAGTADAAAYDRFRTQITGPGKQTVNFGSNGTPVISPGVPTSAPDGAAGYKYTQTGGVPNPAGTPVTTTASGRVPNAAIAGALGRFLSRVVTPISVGMAIYDLARELGFTVSNDDGQAGAELTKDVQLCGGAGTSCYWRTYALAYTDASSGLASCTLYGQGSLGASYGYVTYNQNADNISGFCYVYRSNGSYYNGVSVSRSGTPTNGVQPATIAELEAAIASKSGWPSTSKVAQAAEAAARANGEILPVESPTVTGPASSTGPTKTSTSTNPDGSTKTTNITNNYTHNYAGDTITTTTTTTTNITNNGTQGNNTTQTDTDTPTEEKSECEKNPDTVGCAKLEDVPQGEIPKSTKLLTYAAESLGFGGGSCPADVVRSIHGQAVTVFSYTKGCEWLTNYVKPIVLLLSAWVAFMILLPGKHE